MLVFRTITLIKAKLPILQLKHSRSIALGPHYNTYVKIVGGGSGRKKGKQLKCGGGIVKPYGEKNVRFGIKPQIWHGNNAWAAEQY